MKNLLKVLLTFAIPSLVYVGCKHELPELPPVVTPPPSGGSGGTSTVATCSPDSVYFLNTISPLVISNCAMSGCHDAISHKDGLNLTNYAGIMSLVKAGNPTGSKLVSITSTTGSDVMPPAPRARLTTAQIDLIKKWISQGAKNNNCNACDTTAYTYSAVVKVIMQNKCVGCHSTTSASAGIDLSTYAGVKVVADNGRLMGSIKQLTGYSAMPIGGKLSDCEITQVQKWVNAGKLNN